MPGAKERGPVPKLEQARVANQSGVKCFSRTITSSPREREARPELQGQPVWRERQQQVQPAPEVPERQQPEQEEPEPEPEPRQQEQQREAPLRQQPSRSMTERVSSTSAPARNSWEPVRNMSEPVHNNSARSSCDDGRSHA